MTLADHHEIKNWDNDRLLNTIKAGEALNWDIQLNESNEEIEYYISSLYNEAFSRSLFN